MRDAHPIESTPSTRPAIPVRRAAVDWAVALPIAGAVALGLAGARLAIGVPLRSLAVAAGAFAAWSVIVGAIARGRAVSTYRAVGLWLGGWAAVLALGLGAVYGVDRAGWWWERLTGYDAVWAEDRAGEVDASPAAFVARHPAFALDATDPGGVVLPAGDHTFAETVVVPRGVGLTIRPGATLRFGPGRSLVAYGPLTARGAPERPITFTARYRWIKWGAVGVVGGGPAVFEHVRFAHARHARVNGLDLVGGLSVLDGAVTIADATFAPMFGKDAVYVRDGQVDMRDSLVRDAAKDGLDLDGGRGAVRGNRFVDCGDEGIDLSGALAVEVDGNTILDRRGGRLAAERDRDAIAARNTLGFSDGSSE